jgi:cell division protein FtsB
MTEREVPAERKRSGQLSGVQIMFAAILAIGLFLAIGLSQRITAGQPLQDAYVRVEAELDSLQQEQGALLATRDYVQSDAFVEQWARDEGKLIRPGEVLIVPVPSGAVTQPTPIPEPSVPIETTPPEPEPWMLWWGLFFDGPPPQL